MSGLGDLRIGVFQSDLLLGAEQLEREDRQRYERFFRDVIRQRGFPLHTASLWNALFFGWDLETGDYLGRGLQATPARSGPAIPVGSIVEVGVGTRIALAEVVYKEGRDDGIDEYACADPAVSGTRIRLARSSAERTREGLILDFDAFKGVNGEIQFDRAARRGWLTGDRHLEVEAEYIAGDAGLDGLTLFGRRVFEEYGEDLFNDLLRDGGAGIGPDERWEYLLSSLQAVDEIANHAPGLRAFGGYHVDAEQYRHDRADQDGLYGDDAFRSAIRSTTRPRNVRAPCYTGVGNLVREWFDRGDGTDEAEQELLNGPGYARLVLETNVAIANAIGEKGMIEDAYVRLDDDYQGGGVWRAVAVNGTPSPETVWHPLIPLGLGYASTISDLPAPASPFEDAGDPIIEASERTWTVTLRRIDLEYGDVAIPPVLLDRLPAGDKVIVDYNDGLGTAWRRTKPVDRERRFVREIRFGLHTFPGVILRCSIAGALVIVKATPLAVPKEIEGRPPLRLEYNERVFAEQSSFERLTSRSFGAARSLTSQIAEVFRARGRPTEDGGLALASTEIVTAILGPGFGPAESMPIVLALQAGDYAYRDGEYRWHPRITRRTSANDRVRIAAHRRSEAGQRLARHIAPRMVAMRIRHLHQGWHPSPGKVASYADALRKNRHGGSPARRSPTWVHVDRAIPDRGLARR